MRLVGCGRFVAEGRGVACLVGPLRTSAALERGFGESVLGSFFLGFVTVAPFTAAARS